MPFGVIGCAIFRPAGHTATVEVRQALGGRYKLLSELGSGGMAVVWRARDEVLGRPVAVKVLAGRFAGDPLSRARIRDEARSAAALSHPNIAQVYDYGESDENGEHLPYVVMELINGPTLQQRVAAGPLPPRTIFRICGEVAAALAAAHADGLVHRDIKMANIMVTPAGAKVVDFGIAAAVGPAAPEEMLVGTPAYLAPERLTGGAVAPASDVYALGVLLYRLLAHESPWSVESTTQMLKAHVYVEPAPLPAVPGVPPPVADLIDRCLRKDPAERPTAAEVSATLGDAAEAALTPGAGREAAGAVPDDLGAETAWQVARTPGNEDTDGRWEPSAEAVPGSAERTAADGGVSVVRAGTSNSGPPAQTSNGVLTAPGHRGAPAGGQGRHSHADAGPPDADDAAGSAGGMLPGLPAGPADGIPIARTGEMGVDVRTDRRRGAAAGSSAVDGLAATRVTDRASRRAGPPGVRLQRRYLPAVAGVTAVVAAVLAGLLLIPEDDEAAPPQAGTVPAAPTIAARSSGAGAPGSPVPKAPPGDIAPATTEAPGRGAIVASGPVPPARTSDAPSTTPTTQSPSPSASPSASPTVAEPPTGRRLVSPGGAAYAICEDGKATLTGWEPAPGFTADPAEPGPALSARIFFVGEQRKYRMTVTCVAGTPTPLVLPL